MIRNRQTKSKNYGMIAFYGLDADFFDWRQDSVVHQDIFHAVFVTADVFSWKSSSTRISLATLYSKVPKIPRRIFSSQTHITRTTLADKYTMLKTIQETVKWK